MRTYQNSHKRMKAGFTLVELSLSIAFIAILSIAVTLIITNSIASYHRGLTLNSINTTGMDLVDDMRAAVQNAPAHPPISDCASIYASHTSSVVNGIQVSSDNKVLADCEADLGHNFVSVVRNANVRIGSKDNNIPVFGAFCTGTYSYIWNSGYFFTDNTESHVIDGNGGGELPSAKFLYRYSASGETPVVKEVSDFKLLKVHDENRSVCVSALVIDSDNRYRENYNITVDNNYPVDNSYPINDGTSVFRMTNEIFPVLDEDPIDIMASNMKIDGNLVDVESEGTSNNLAIYDLYAATPASNSAMNSLFYYSSFILATIQGGINISASGNYCATPEGFDSDIENFDYCAINKFNFAAQANGG